ncbi:class I SAM-dependent methyltransferase [Actinomadura roseirufa]|uniref:class I SAM-dependent methyltransferase n=1 Tax=Actinomadura roseirufa TaxID=2094049 RepID=UPI0010416047|nr:class I SAM-dependent methyltransferase [Actinomadura roseirufa]
MPPPAPRLLDDDALERSPVVANCAMNRERTLAGYVRELGIDVIAELGTGPARWLDLCCGSGRALVEAAGRLPPDAEIIGVDLTDHFSPGVPPRTVRLVTASVTGRLPEGPFDLITCVYGLHYVGDRLGVLTRAAALLGENGLLVANFDARSVRTGEGSARRVTAALSRAGFGYDGRRRVISVRGRCEPALDYRYLGADDRADPNYTGQEAVDAFYEPGVPDGGTSPIACEG